VISDSEAVDKKQESAEYNTSQKAMRWSRAQVAQILEAPCRTCNQDSHLQEAVDAPGVETSNVRRGSSDPGERGSLLAAGSNVWILKAS
jgi:hypothetical protein